MSKKGTSILPFAFITLVVALGIISWSFYNTYFGSRYQATVFEQSKLDTMNNEMEKGKKFLKQACIYSSHQSTLESAVHGGVILPNKKINSWICNVGPPLLPPDYFYETKKCLEKFTKSYTNAYYSNFNSDLPVDISKQPFEASVYGVTRSGVFSGKYDDSFNIFLDGGKVSLSAGNMKISDVLGQKEMIDRNRFWYMWRKFYKWAAKNIYGRGMCDCVSTCGGCKCAEKVAQKSFEDLRSRFDQYVSCQKTCNCCYSCEGSDCGIDNRPGCGYYCKIPKSDSCNIDQLFITVDYWAPKKCRATCGKECAKIEATFPSDENVFEKNNTSYLGSKTTSQNAKGSTSSSQSGNKNVVCAPYFMENRLASVHTFSCTDRKHHIPTGNGPKPLTFKVKAFGGYYDNDGCGCKFECRNESALVCPELTGMKCPNYHIYDGFMFSFLQNM